MGDVNNSAGSELKRVVAANFQGAGDDGRNGLSLSRDGASSYVDRGPWAFVLDVGWMIMYEVVVSMSKNY